MSEFKKLPASKASARSRKPVYGVGLNDAWYMVRPVINGVRTTCPAYDRWHDMLSRCYCKKLHERQPAYIGAAVCGEWLVFSVFSAWFDDNFIKGYHLDKDLKAEGNKIYSPDSCLFVPRSINNLITKRAEGECSRGVSRNKLTGNYQVQISENGKMRYIGTHKDHDSAVSAYKVEKDKLIKREMKANPQLSGYLSRYLSKRKASLNTNP